ncbi:tetratricopeptide repeat protein [Haliea sp. E17]|uniref:tetratricopeptide repeat protein n=1 Tax=Haliea sp. E17 TaxID=3401576 RepID=UPI003AAFEFC5
MFRLIVLLPALALLAACAATPEQPAAESPAQVEAAPPAPEPEPLERPFPEASVYPLLVAEFALRRGDYDTAMNNYIEQARVLDDAGVARHTTHLAQFLDNDELTLEAVQLWLRKQPEELEANNTAATLLSRQGRPLEAIPHLSVVARSAHQANFPMLLQSYASLSPEDQQQLVTALDALSGEFPDDPALLLTQALVHAENHEYAVAQAKLDALFAIEPAQPQALQLEARMQLQQGAEHPFARIEQVLEKDPGNSRLRLEYARLLTATDTAAARRQFEILSAQSPDDADLLLSLALLNRETGDDLVARAYLMQVLDTGDRTNEAHFYLGLIAEKAGDEQAALEHYRSIDDSRQYLPANQRIGELLLEQGDVQGLREWFAQQRAAQPQWAEQLYGIEAEVLRGKGATTAAMQILNEGLATYPDSESLRYARSMLNQQQADLASMEADLRDIIAQNPDNATALNALGYTLADQTDRLDEAEALISRALELQPGEPAILDSMGWLLYRKGDLPGALRYLTRAYASFPDPEVAAHLGEVLWASGEQDKARQVWQGGLLADPQHQVLRATLQRLGVELDLPPPLPPSSSAAQ